MENGRVIFKSRPGPNGIPKNENFKYEDCPYPNEIDGGELLIQTLFLSVDPAQRCQMNEATGVDYLSPWELGETIVGLGGIGQVVSSKHINFKEGDVVTSMQLNWPWKRYFSVTGDVMTKVDTNLLGDRVSLFLSCFGLIGPTVLIGFWEKGKVKSGDTLVVSGAAGACGTLAGQIGRLLGATRVVGICGTDHKCDILTERLKFDTAVNYKLPDFKDCLQKACPQGVDVYFDNVGGPVSDSVIKLMNPGGRIVLCGQISQYNSDVPYPPPLDPSISDIVNKNCIERERFTVVCYMSRVVEAQVMLSKWLAEAKFEVLETVSEGLESAGGAFVSMMSGGNVGKQLVKVSAEA